MAKTKIVDVTNIQEVSWTVQKRKKIGLKGKFDDGLMMEYDVETLIIHIDRGTRIPNSLKSEIFRLTSTEGKDDVQKDSAG